MRTEEEKGRKNVIFGARFSKSPNLDRRFVGLRENRVLLVSARLCRELRSIQVFLQTSSITPDPNKGVKEVERGFKRWQALNRASKLSLANLDKEFFSFHFLYRRPTFFFDLIRLAALPRVQRTLSISTTSLLQSIPSRTSSSCEAFGFCFYSQRHLIC